MQKLLILSFLLCLLIACASQNDSAINQETTAENTTQNEPINEKGHQLFQANCASCHHIMKDATGPVLKGTRNRIPSKQWLYDWMENPAKVIASKEPYAVALFEKWNKTQMTAFPNLSHDDIDAIIDYCDSDNGSVIVD